MPDPFGNWTLTVGCWTLRPVPIRLHSSPFVQNHLSRSPAFSADILSDQPQPMTTFSPSRAALVMLLIAAAMLTLLGRVAYLQTYGRQQTLERAERQQHQ